MNRTTLFSVQTFDPLERERAEIQRPLDRKNKVVDREMFWSVLMYGKSHGPGRSAKDPLLTLKMRVLQDL